MAWITRIALSTFIEHEPSEVTAFTDPVSNTVVLEDIGLLNSLSNLRTSSLPLRYMGPLLHEATHHMTFDSKVGHALMAMASSALGILGSTDETDDRSAPEELTMALVDTITHRFVSRVFEPLIEGLALFSEHDLTVGDSDVVSRPSQIGRLLFEPRAIGEDGRPRVSESWGAYRSLLFSLRRSPESIAAKQQLLEQPLYGRPNYLLGYLAAKTLYRDLAQRSPRLADPELFLILMVDYWFSDYKLACLIAKPLGQPAATVDPDGVLTQHRFVRVLEYLQDRLDDLYRNADRFSAECEQFIAGKSGQAPSYRGGGDSGALSTHKIGLFMRFAKLEINVFFPKVFGHRRDFRFSSARVDVTVTTDREAVVSTKDGRVFCRTEAVANAALGTHEGSVEGIIVMDPELRRIAIGIFAGDGLVAVLDAMTGEWNPESLAKHLDCMPSRFDVEGVMHALSQARSGFANSKARTLMARNDAEAERFIRFFYPKILFWGRGPQARDKVACLETNGLRGVLDDDLFNFVARSSLLCAVPAPATAIADALQISRGELRELIETANGNAQSQLGIWLFGLAGDHILGHV
jgi:hypothetical protein